jgi:hypothetical protein
MQVTRREIKERALVARYTRNVLRVYRKAPQSVKRAGANWYAIEADKLTALAVEIGAERIGVIGAAAAISPGMRWDLVDYYVRELAGPNADQVTVPTYSHANTVKALQCLNGHAPDDVLGGPKVRAFYELLRTRGESDAVVIDGHAFNIARAERTGLRGEGIPPAARVTAARYRWASKAYQRAAEILGIAPHAVQAVTWLQWRNQWGIA